MYGFAIGCMNSLRGDPADLSRIFHFRTCDCLTDISTRAWAKSEIIDGPNQKQSLHRPYLPPPLLFLQAGAEAPNKKEVTKDEEEQAIAKARSGDYNWGEENAGCVVAFGKFFFASPALTRLLPNPAFRVLVFPNIPLSPYSVPLDPYCYDSPRRALKRTFDLTSAVKLPFKIEYEECDNMPSFFHDHLGGEITVDEYRDWDSDTGESGSEWGARLKRELPWVLHLALKPGTDPKLDSVFIAGESPSSAEPAYASVSALTDFVKSEPPSAAMDTFIKETCSGQTRLDNKWVQAKLPDDMHLWQVLDGHPVFYDLSNSRNLHRRDA